MIAQDYEMPVYFDYCGTPGDYMVILRMQVTNLYICDVGFLRGCNASDGCTDGYHIASICGKGRVDTSQHFASKEEAAESLFEVWRGNGEAK